MPLATASVASGCIGTGSNGCSSTCSSSDPTRSKLFVRRLRKKGSYKIVYVKLLDQYKIFISRKQALILEYGIVALQGRRSY